MTILQALDRYYGRMAARGEADDLGFTRESISFVLVLDRSGRVQDVNDIRQTRGKKPAPVRMSVPRPKRTSNIQANFLWDKTSYVFGVDSGKSKRLKDENASFGAFHRELLAGCDEPEAIALLRFVENWRLDSFAQAPFSSEMLDASFVFRLDGGSYFHDVPPLRDRWLASLRDPHAPIGMCLVSGREDPVETGHAVIKGVQDAQSSGAYLVSYNSDAYTSYGKKTDATNAPVSKDAAARYGAALNRMLDRDSPNRVRRTVGDATVVFWAEASGEDAAAAAESFFADAFDPPFDAEPKPNPETDKQAAAKLRNQLEKIAAGRPGEADAKLRPDTRFHVLGLAPNAARLSVRYWLDDDFSSFAKRLLEHARDLAIAPPPRGWGHKQPSVARLLVKTTALQEKFDNIPPLLAGEVMRAVLAGTRYPRTWLASAIIRLRAGDDPGTGWHAAVIRAVLERDRRLKYDEDQRHVGREIPVSLDRTRPDDPAYHLGRLFAALETAQRLALGNVNATIRDRYFGAASATPAGVFPLLLRGAQNHIGKLRKERKDVWIEREIGAIVELLPPALPRSLKLEAQGRFAIGYYHQRQAQFAGRPKLAVEIGTVEGETPEEEIADV